MILITDDLARRLEHIQAADDAACAEVACGIDPCCQASVLSVAGGYLTFCGSNSPLTHAIGLGMHGRVSPGELEEVEDFFQSRDAAVTIDVTPHSDPSLPEMLCERGYTIAEFTNVLVRGISPGEAAPTWPGKVAVRVVEDEEELELHARTMCSGYLSRTDITADELTLGRLLSNLPYGRAYLAEVEGEAAGGSCMSIRDGIGNCFGDGTLPSFRRTGVHTAMICARIGDAIAAGCELLTASTQPGSVSQKNYQTLGFTVAYSKITMVL